MSLFITLFFFSSRSPSFFWQSGQQTNLKRLPDALLHCELFASAFEDHKILPKSEYSRKKVLQALKLDFIDFNLQ